MAGDAEEPAHLFRVESLPVELELADLRALTVAGLVRRIEPAGSVARYEARVGDNHHHVVCRGCGTIADVDCAVDYRPCLVASDDHGFVIDEAEVTDWGICPACAALPVD